MPNHTESTAVPRRHAFPRSPALLLWVSISALLHPWPALADADADLVRAAKSPYDLARFVDTHPDFDPAPLWKALGIDRYMVDSMPFPASGCSEELIAVLDPPQAIVLLRGGIGHWQEVYLRFRRPAGLDQPGPWTFAGYFLNTLRPIDSKHELIRFGSKPYLLVTSEQQQAGVGWRAVDQTWIDLTAARLQPVFELTVEDYDSVPLSIGLRSTGYVVSLDATPVERITVAYDVRFEFPFPATGDLGSRSGQAVYTRRGDRFVFDAALSKTPKAEIDKLYRFDTEQRPSNEDRLRYTLPELKKIAAGADAGHKAWLKEFLAECGNTPEKREIQALLSSRSPKGR
jgi:hypothetical protein